MEKPQKATGEKKTLQQKLLALGLAGTIALGGATMLSACDSNENNEQPSTPPVTSTETPNTAQGQSDGFVTPEDPGTPAGESPNEGDNPELNGHTQEEYDKVKTLADETVLKIKDLGYTVERVAIFPEETQPNGDEIALIIEYIDSSGEKKVLITLTDVIPSLR